MDGPEFPVHALESRDGHFELSLSHPGPEPAVRSPAANCRCISMQVCPRGLGGLSSAVDRVQHPGPIGNTVHHRSLLPDDCILGKGLTQPIPHRDLRLLINFGDNVPSDFVAATVCPERNESSVWARATRRRSEMASKRPSQRSCGWIGSVNFTSFRSPTS